MTGPAQAGRSFPKRSFVRPSWMEEDTVDSAGASEFVFFSKVSSLLARVSRVQYQLWGGSALIFDLRSLL